MTKVLFSSSTTNVVDLQTLQPVMEEMGRTTDYHIVALVNLNQYVKDFPKGRIDYKNINDYKTKNVNKILEIEKPDLIVVAVNSIVETVLMVAGKSKSIPTLYVSHAVFPLLYRRQTKVIQEKLHRLFFRKTMRQLLFFICSGLGQHIFTILRRSMVTGYDAGMEYATKICANGENEKAALIKQGIDAKKITVTGQPRFDVLYSDRWKDSRGRVFNDFDFSLEDKLILILTQPFFEDGLWSREQRETLVTGLLTEIQTILGCFPIIKIHPRESVESYKTILDHLGLSTVPVVRLETPLYDLLSASDLVIGVSSTAMLEAMIFDKTVIMANLFNEPDHFGFISSGAVLPVNSLEDLPSVVRTAFHDEEFMKKMSDARSKFVYNNAYIQDGLAAQRISKLIVQMIEQQHVENGGIKGYALNDED
jgi:hypothetical protein